MTVSELAELFMSGSQCIEICDGWDPVYKGQLHDIPIDLCDVEISSIDNLNKSDDVLTINVILD